MADQGYYYLTHFAPEVRTHLEAGAFRAVVKHLGDRSAQVQNIDLMIIGGFCRNCLAKWLVKEARDLSAEMKSADENPKEVALLDAFGHSQAARDVYGCDFFRWKKKFPQKATFEQMQQYQESEAIHAVHKNDRQLKTGMTVAMTTEFEAKFKMRLEAGAFRSLLQHLSERSDAVQNIDLMTISGFCRNCLSKWLVVEARKLASTIRGVCQDSFTEEEEQLVRDLDAFGYEEGAEYVYGCDYNDWKKAHAKKASSKQISMYKLSSSIHAAHDKALLEKQDEAGLAKYSASISEPQDQQHQYQHQQEESYGPVLLPPPPVKKETSNRPSKSILRVKDQSAPRTSKHSSKHSPKPKVPLSDVCCDDVDACNTPEAKNKSSEPMVGTRYRTPPPPKVNLSLRIGILTVSDRAARNEYENGDLSGPAVETALAESIGKVNSKRSETDETRAMIEYCVRAIVPDETDDIKTQLLDWSNVDDGNSCDLIFTTGGTGFSPRDVTPEATREVIEREASGLMSFATSLCANIQPLAALSRCTAGIRGETVIVNLPGNPAGVGQMLDILVPILMHAVKDVKGL